MIVWHCSTVKIKEFDFSKGVHFGGELSALEAGLRKKQQGVLYLHKVKLNFDKVLDSEDLGSTEKWLQLRIEALEEGAQAVRYINRYEPDFCSSWYVLDDSCVTVLGVQEITCNEAEELLCLELY